MAKRQREEQSDEFGGFEDPESNYSKLPHAFIEALPLMKAAGEMKVILYVLRHTWGFHEDSKRITLDEFENGRVVKDTEEHKTYPRVGGKRRMDMGVGMSRNAIRRGIAAAVEHGFLCVEKDDRDRARQKRFYRLHMQLESDQGVQNGPSGGPKRTLGGAEMDPRSEKETIGKKPLKATSSRTAASTESERHNDDDVSNFLLGTVELDKNQGILNSIRKAMEKKSLDLGDLKRAWEQAQDGRNPQGLFVTMVLNGFVHEETAKPGEVPTINMGLQRFEEV